MPLAVAAGLVAALLAVYVLVAQGRTMPLLLLRTLEVQRHLAAGAAPPEGLAVLGSSVVLEGIDCTAVGATLPPGARCENLGWTAGNPRQWLLIAPALRRRPPALVVLGLDLLGLLHPDPIAPNLLALAGWWEFVPRAERGALRGVLREEELRALSEPRLLHLLRLRSFPLDALNERMRELARPELRFEGYATNFADPWISRGPLRPLAMERHLARMTELVQVAPVERLAESERVLSLLVEELRAAAPRTRLLFVLTPLHPELRRASEPALDAARRSLTRLSGPLDAAFADHSAAFPVELFSDALHLSAAGRAAWSARLGAAAAPLLAAN